MMKKILLAAVLGGLVLFVWGAVSWMVLPWHTATMHASSNDAVLIDALRAGIPSSGLYIVPAMPPATSGDAMRAYQEKVASGPSAMIFAWTSQPGSMPASMFVFGYIFFFLVTLLAAVLLSLAGSKLRGYGARVFFVAIIGLIVAVDVHISAWNWMMFPADYSIVMALDAFVAWLLAGLVIAAIVKPAEPAAAPASAATPAPAA